MSKSCKCGSYAINQHCHGRMLGVDLDLCDVCYWRKRAESACVVAAEQAEDEGLWFVAQTAPEDTLQRALRRLAAAVEGE